eukprot:3516078-Amphidinium_carterae.2
MVLRKQLFYSFFWNYVAKTAVSWPSQGLIWSLALAPHPCRDGSARFCVSFVPGGVERGFVGPSRASLVFGTRPPPFKTVFSHAVAVTVKGRVGARG